MAALTIAPRATVEAQAADPQTLSWLCYPGHAAPEVIGPFEQENNVKILAKEYSGGEKMMALINGSPPGSFDVVTSDEAYVSQLIKADYIEQLNPADFPLGEFWPDFQKFPLHWVDGKLYTIMTSWGANGLIYNADKLIRGRRVLVRDHVGSPPEGEAWHARLVSALHGVRQSCHG